MCAVAAGDDCQVGYRESRSEILVVVWFSFSLAAYLELANFSDSWSCARNLPVTVGYGYEDAKMVEFLFFFPVHSMTYFGPDNYLTCVDSPLGGVCR
jgi:hypothetical protein